MDSKYNGVNLKQKDNKGAKIMSKIFKLSIFVAVLAIAFGFAFSPSPAQAAGHENFNLKVKHNINGQSLGLDKALPVDIYANGNYVDTFSFGEIFKAELPAGNYFIEVKLAGTSTVVMSLGPTDIPADVDVTIRATLGADKTPTLRVNIK
jgi:hypothetical protein